MTLAILCIIIIYIFTFINGLHDGCNVIATIITSRSLSPKKALIIAALVEFVSPLLLGTSVAATMGKGIINNEFIDSGGVTNAYSLILFAISGAIIWNVITWWFGLPSSSSHALIGGLIGSGISVFGVQSIYWANILSKVILMLLVTPLVGFMIGCSVLAVTKNLCKVFNPEINKFFKTSQLFGMVFLAASHSTNDAQKSMGIVTLVLMIGGIQAQFYVPVWVKIVSSLAMALGLTLGGWKIAKTVGRGIYKVKPAHSFISQVSAATVVFISGLMGSPVSTSQIVSSSIMGVGAGEKLSAVRWGVVKNILVSWVVTIPAVAVISFSACAIVIQLF